MFGTNIMMTHPASFFNGELEHLLRSRREINLPTPVLTKTAHPLYHLTNSFRFQPQFSQYPTGDTTLFLNEAEEQVLSADNILAHPFCFLVCQAQNTARPLGKTFHSRQGFLLFTYMP